ncbi:7-cyano-7-deazaguanine synthase [Phycicoccus flavus]|uniref:7-cyano-7-deazaguanine synthase n=1 Tax=Phycicoccus flavus TaxID=2502783 RepID=UPI00389A53DD
MTYAGSCAVLLSGGIDSAVVAHALRSQGWDIAALFVDYGQPAREAERTASTRVAAHYDLPWQEVGLTGMSVPQSGEIPGRNDMLIALARATLPGRSIAVGIHGGTEYADCSPAWTTAWQQLIDAQSGGVARILAPLLHRRKDEIISHARYSQVPIHLTHSCERANDPCGQCLSCQDWERARVGAK